jgi:hypothetical protein
MKKIDLRFLITAICSIVALALVLFLASKVKIQMGLKITHTEDSFISEGELYSPIDGLNENDGFQTALELEIGLNLTKLTYPSEINELIEDDDINLIDEFNKLYFTESESYDVDTLLKDEYFLDRLYELTQIILKKNNTKYYNQRLFEIESLRNVTCQPHSLVISAQSIGLEIKPLEFIEYFIGDVPELKNEYKALIEYAKTYGDWTQSYIDNNKLYQIAGTFVYGVNIYPAVKESDYVLKFGYKSLNWIYEYIQTYGTGVLISTYLPYLVKDNWKEEDKLKLKGGHVVYLRDVLQLKIKEDNKIYRKFLGVILEDPFGNSNTDYDLLDGHGNILPINKFKQCVKTEYTDKRRSYHSDEEIRVMYWVYK